MCFYIRSKPFVFILSEHICNATKTNRHWPFFLFSLLVKDCFKFLYFVFSKLFVNFELTFYLKPEILAKVITSPFFIQIIEVWGLKYWEVYAVTWLQVHCQVAFLLILILLKKLFLNIYWAIVNRNSAVYIKWFHAGSKHLCLFL